MEKMIGVIIGGVIALMSLGIIFLLAGGAVIAAMTAFLALPIAAPVTTTLVIVMIVAGYIVFRKKTPRNTDDP